MSEAKSTTAWKLLTYGGASLLIAAIGTFGADFATMGQYELIGTHDGFFLLAIALGTSILLVGLIGLASQRRRQSRPTIVAGTIVIVITIWLVSLLLRFSNRPFVHFLWPLIPLSIIGIVLILRASSGRKD
jgi:hypothetical protein